MMRIKGLVICGPLILFVLLVPLARGATTVPTLTTPYLSNYADYADSSGVATLNQSAMVQFFSDSAPQERTTFGFEATVEVLSMPASSSGFGLVFEFTVSYGSANVTFAITLCNSSILPPNRTIIFNNETLAVEHFISLPENSTITISLDLLAILRTELGGVGLGNSSTSAKLVGRYIPARGLPANLSMNLMNAAGGHYGACSLFANGESCRIRLTQLSLSNGSNYSAQVMGAVAGGLSVAATVVVIARRRLPHFRRR